MPDHPPADNRRRPPAVRSIRALGVKEDSMSRMVEHTHPGWMQQPPAPHAGEGTRQVDGAWRVWEKLRAWDQRFAIAVDATLAVGLFVITSGWLEALAK